MGKVAESDLDIRYDATAIQFMDQKRDRLYDLWLGLATEHALKASRHRVLKEDFQATIDDAVRELLEAVSAEGETSIG